MKDFLLRKVRLSYYFIFFYFFYFIVAAIFPEVELDRPLLTLFSINSFLYGFYISPILSSQRNRVDDLHKAIRAEANALFAMVLKSKKLPKKLHHEFQGMVTDYVYAILKQKPASNGEVEYEKIIGRLVNYGGKEQDLMGDILKDVVANQGKRSNIHLLIQNKVYRSEWIVMLFLFMVTISFVLFIDAQGQLYFELIIPMLCTGLTMLIVILIKMNRLTHKKAKQIWLPYETLLKSKFYKIDD